MGRTRTLLGTVPVLVRLPAALADALSDWAKDEGISRNTLVGRELATAVTRRKRSNVPEKPDRRETRRFTAGRV